MPEEREEKETKRTFFVRLGPTMYEYDDYYFPALGGHEKLLIYVRSRRTNKRELVGKLTRLVVNN